MEKAKVFVEIFDEDHEQKPRSRDFYFAPAATIDEIKQEVQNFIGISNVDMTVSLDGRNVNSGSLLQASGGASVASKLRITYRIIKEKKSEGPKQTAKPGMLIFLFLSLRQLSSCFLLQISNSEPLRCLFYGSTCQRKDAAGVFGPFVHVFES
jgi:hypothetical protein